MSCYLDSLGCHHQSVQQNLKASNSGTSYLKFLCVEDLNSFGSIHSYKQYNRNIYPLMSTENKTKNLNSNLK